MTLGAVGESFRRVTKPGDMASGSLMLSAGNMERLVAKLSRMRGAALKMGQMMSFQGICYRKKQLFHQLTFVQTQRCCQGQSMKFFSVFRIAPTTCLHHSVIQSFLAISDRIGVTCSYLSTRNQWQQHQLDKFTVLCYDPAVRELQ